MFFCYYIFFQQKRKKTSSPILTLHSGNDASYLQNLNQIKLNDLRTNETQDSSHHTEYPKSNIYESVSNCVKSIVGQTTGCTLYTVCLGPSPSWFKNCY